MTIRGGLNGLIVVVIAILTLVRAVVQALILLHLPALLQIIIALSLCCEILREGQESKITLKYSLI